jgi:ribosomal protein S18 acetylase RimI-like enzyme
MSSLRPLTEDDAPEVARLMNEHWPEPVDPGEIASEWTSPKIDLARDGRMGDGVTVLVEDIGEERGWIDLQGRPVPDAFDWAEAQLRQRGWRRAFTGGWSTNDELFGALEGRGYRHTRSSWRMEVRLVSTPQEPWSPDGIEVRPLQVGEERDAYEVHQEAFEDTWEPIRWSYDEWAHAYVGPSHFEPALWFLAWDGSDACGVAICRRHGTDLELGWVAVLAVRRGWRRRGIGHALLGHAFAAFAERGLTRAGLGVDAESPTGANSLYEDVGMSATNRFDIYERVLA